MKINILYLALILCALNSQAQTSTFPVNGATDNRHTIYAFTNALIQTDPEVSIENGIMLIQDGVILEIGTAVKIPQSAIIYDLKGKCIYASFIDSYTSYGMPEIKRGEWSPRPQTTSFR